MAKKGYNYSKCDSLYFSGKKLENYYEKLQHFEDIKIDTVLKQLSYPTDR